MAADSVGSLLGGFDTTGTLTTIYWTVLAIFVFVGIIGIIGFMFWKKMYNKRVVIREITSTRRVLRFAKAREFKDKSGHEGWIIWRTGEVLPGKPPADAVEIDIFGYKCAEVYKLENGEFQWAHDTGVVGGFQPLTANQRIPLINQIVKSHSRRSKDWRDYVVPAVAIASFTIIVLALIIFYGDMGAPLLEMGKQQVELAHSQEKVMGMLQEIIQKKQIIGGAAG